MAGLIECIPNFSEGRDKAIINSIANSIKETDGVTLLNVDPGEATNRTVVTFAGTPQGVFNAAFNSIKRASELIDMRKHKGAHPRMGAADVCPLVPISGVTMKECIEIANRLGKRVGEELKIPIYLYEYAAKNRERRNLANIRKGEYEGLEEKLKDPDWLPDYGPSEFNPKSGATVIGVREFLIAYNVNLNTRDRKLAHKIALNIREAGKAKRDKNGKIMRDSQGNSVKIPGTLKETKAVGWYIDEYRMAQVSINLTNYKITPPHIAFEEVSRQAKKLGLRVTGSEVVGLIPKEAMLLAGRYYLGRQGKCTGVPEKELIRVAIQSMGLNEVSEFRPEEKIIEYRVLKRKDSLIDLLTCRDFVDELSSDSPAPGGGSVSALIGSLSAALTSMVANLTFGKKGYENYSIEMNEIADKTQKIKDEFLDSCDADTDAFNKLMEAFRLKRKTNEEKKIRRDAIQSATKNAILVPLKVMKEAREIIKLTRQCAEKANVNAISDIGVSALCARSAASGAKLNVLINLKTIEDEEWKNKIKKEAAKIEKEVITISEEINEVVKEKMRP